MVQPFPAIRLNEAPRAQNRAWWARLLIDLARSHRLHWDYQE